LVLAQIAIDWPEDLTNQTSVTVQHVCKTARVNAFRKRWKRSLLCSALMRFKYLPIKFPLQRHPDHSARDPNLGGPVPLDIPIAHSPVVLEQ
jgi:hypothetical protein